MLNDAHCHFFSHQFFSVLSRQRGRGETSEQLCRELQWDDPGTPEALAERWIRELDAHGVGRVALIASVPGDEESVAAAVARYPNRLVGFFMLDPSAPNAADRARRAIEELGLRGLCLFPAMNHVPLDDGRVQQVIEVAAARPGVAVFVHCGVLSVGVRRRLGLPSTFDLRLGDPLGVARLALAYPNLPFIIPHLGAGMLREALMAAEACANLHLDTSSSNSWIRYVPGLTLEAVFKAAIAVAGPRRLLFGTDSSFFPRGWQRGIYDAQKAAIASLGLPEADETLIFGGNFDRLFELPTPDTQHPTTPNRQLPTTFNTTPANRSGFGG
jgi:predicted TIM-barrel fold metal-dependent hydrolase